MATEPVNIRPTVQTLGFEQPRATQELVQPTTYYAPAAPQIGDGGRVLDLDTTQSVLGAPENASLSSGP